MVIVIISTHKLYLIWQGHVCQGVNKNRESLGRSGWSENVTEIEVTWRVSEIEWGHLESQEINNFNLFRQNDWGFSICIGHP